MTSFFNDDKQCRNTDCTHGATSTGLCRACTQAARNRTTDGVRTGARPKLTPEQVVELRRMYAALMSKREIARHFGVDAATVSNYLKAESQ